MKDFKQWEGKRSSLLSALVVLLGLAVLVTNFGCKRSSSSKDSGKDPNAEIKTVLHLEPFVVNLADPEDNHFLRVGVDLGLDVALSGKEGKGGEGSVPMARIRDCILEVLSSWHSDALLAPEGKEKLKNELLRALHARAPEVGVKEIYFTDFLVQR
jgi:flagellar FliL protein